MRQHQGSELTIPQLVYALKLKLRQTVKQEVYVPRFFFFFSDCEADEISARAVPLIRLEDVRQALLVWSTRLSFPIGSRTGNKPPFYSSGRQVVGEHVQSCEPPPSRSLGLDPDISTPQT